MANEVIGEQELLNQLKSLPRKIRKRMVPHVEELARQIQQKEREKIPVDTGAARAGVKVRYSGDKLSAEIGVFDPTLYYVVFLEFGTSSIPANPWYLPAALWARQVFLNRMAAALNKAMAK